MAVASSPFTRIPLQQHYHIPFTPATTPYRYKFRSQLRVKTSAWKEYEDALQDRDLLRALHLLESLETSSSMYKDLESKEENENTIYDEEGAASRPRTSAAPLLLQPARNWEILDTCLYCQDMELVSKSYGFLHSIGFLPTFGKFRNMVTEGPRNVTPMVLKDLTGLEAYLLGCPVRGVILEPLQAMQMGIQGQAGTQFWDKTLESELSEGRLTSASFNRYSMVLFAGIAAEALVYGQAEGGESDENLFKAIASLLRPQWSVAQMSNQARWAVLQSYDLLKNHKMGLRAAVKALEKTTNLGFVMRKIEDALTADH